MNSRLTHLIGYFLKLGCIGFGGPPAHIALMRVDVVDELRWIDSEQFNADLASANLLPGPTSTELAIYIGYRMCGVVGAIAAGVSFILPAFLLVLALSMAYVQLQGLPQFESALYAIKPIALALVLHGTAQLGQPVLLGWRAWLLWVVALLALMFLPVEWVLVLFAAGVAFVGLNAQMPPRTGLAVLAPFTFGAAVSTASIFCVFLKIGVIIYGGGFAMVGFLQQELVGNLMWLTRQQLLDAIAIGQATPGPVFTTATFVGYVVGGLPGAVAATAGIFSPAFVFVMLEDKLLGPIKNKPWVKTFLRGVLVATIASIVLAAAQLARHALVDWFTWFTAAAVLLLLLQTRLRIGAHWLVLVGVLIGLGRLFVLG